MDNHLKYCGCTVSNLYASPVDVITVCMADHRWNGPLNFYRLFYGQNGCSCLLYKLLESDIDLMHFRRCMVVRFDGATDITMEG